MQFHPADSSPQDNSPFLCGVTRFLQKVAYAGMVNGLSQALLKIACPGVPGYFYQGSELWSRNLVDPDKRRPVDFQSRTGALQAFSDNTQFNASEVARHLLAEWPIGRIKLWMIWKAPWLLAPATNFVQRGGIYSSGSDRRSISPHSSRFLRRHQEEHAVIIIPRWATNIPMGVETTALGTFWSGTNVQLPVSSPDSLAQCLHGKAHRDQARRRESMHRGK